MTTVGQLRQICGDIPDRIAGWDDDTGIRTGPSTYGPGDAIPETKDGFIDHYDIREDDGDHYGEDDE